MKPPRYEDDIISDVEALGGCLVKILVGISLLAGFILCFASCSSTTPASVKFTRTKDGKETLTVTYDPGNHIRVGNLILSPSAIP